MQKPRKYGSGRIKNTRPAKSDNPAETTKAISTVNRFVENEEQNAGTIKTLKEKKT